MQTILQTGYCGAPRTVQHQQPEHNQNCRARGPAQPGRDVEAGKLNRERGGIKKNSSEIQVQKSLWDGDGVLGKRKAGKRSEYCTVQVLISAAQAHCVTLVLMPSAPMRDGRVVSLSGSMWCRYFACRVLFRPLYLSSFPGGTASAVLSPILLPHQFMYYPASPSVCSNVLYSILCQFTPMSSVHATSYNPHCDSTA